MTGPLTLETYLAARVASSYLASPYFAYNVATGGYLERTERLLASGILQHPAVGQDERELLRKGFALKFVSPQASTGLTMCTCYQEKSHDR